jgi:hypothetical protein
MVMPAVMRPVAVCMVMEAVLGRAVVTVTPMAVMPAAAAAFSTLAVTMSMFPPVQPLPRVVVRDLVGPIVIVIVDLAIIRRARLVRGTDDADDAHPRGHEPLERARHDLGPGG